MKSLKFTDRSILTHPKYVHAAYYLHTYGKELELSQKFVDQCLTYLQTSWEKIGGKRSYQQIALALIYLESRRTKFHIPLKNLTVLLQKSYRGLRSQHIINTAAEFRKHLNLEKSIMSLQDIINQSIKKMKASPLFLDYIKRYQTWVDRPIEQLVFYTNQITGFLRAKRNLPISTLNMAATVLYGANYLLGKSIGRKQAYFRQEDIATELGLKHLSLSDIYYRQILPVLRSEAFKRVLKQWED